jgi:putative transposase
VRQWYHRLAHLFDLERDYYATVAVDETKVSVENSEVYVWAAVDVDTFEVVHIEVSPSRSDLDALLFLKTVLKRCRGQPVTFVDRGPWYTGRSMTSISASHAVKRGGNGRLSRPVEIPNQVLY